MGLCIPRLRKKNIVLNYCLIVTLNGLRMKNWKIYRSSSVQWQNRIGDHCASFCADWAFLSGKYMSSKNSNWIRASQIYFFFLQVLTEFERKKTPRIRVRFIAISIIISTPKDYGYDSQPKIILGADKVPTPWQRARYRTSLSKRQLGILYFRRRRSRS